MNKLISLLIPRVEAALLEPIKLIDPFKGTGPKSLPDLIDKLAGIIFTISIAIAPIFYVYAGYQLMTSGGDAKKIQTGWNTVKWTTVGVAIVLLANAITGFIKNFLEVS